MQSPLQTSVQELRIARYFEGICAWTDTPIPLNLKRCTHVLAPRRRRSSLTCATMRNSPHHDDADRTTVREHGRMPSTVMELVR